MHPTILKGYTAHSVINIHYLFVSFVKEDIKYVKIRKLQRTENYYSVCNNSKSIKYWLKPIIEVCIYKECIIMYWNRKENCFPSNMDRFLTTEVIITQHIMSKSQNRQKKTFYIKNYPQEELFKVLKG